MHTHFFLKLPFKFNSFPVTTAYNKPLDYALAL